MAAEDGYRLEDQVGHLMRRAQQRHLVVFAGVIPDLTTTQFAAIAKLAEQGAMSQNQLGRATAMDAATIKGVVGRLVARRLVATAADTTDRRRLVVELTPEGRELYDAGRGAGTGGEPADVGAAVAGRAGRVRGVVAQACVKGVSMGELRCVAPVGDITGEGAVWAGDEGCLYWTDINRFLVHRLDGAGAVRTWFFDEPATALALTERPGTLVVALGSRLILWRPADDSREPLGPPLPGAPRVRFNDGRPDPLGRLVIGTMGNNVGPDGEGLDVEPGLGRLYAFTRGGGFEELQAGIGIANTVCWSPDARRFYFADTMANAIRVHDFDPATGAVGAARPFLVGHDRGAPDGSAVDSDGFLWNARYGGGCVLRVAPDGTVERVIEVPCGNVTTCTFGGADLGTLYITTARGGQGRSERLAGSVFALEAPVPGLPERVFRLGRSRSSSPRR